MAFNLETWKCFTNVVISICCSKEKKKKVFLSIFFFHDLSVIAAQLEIMLDSCLFTGPQVPSEHRGGDGGERRVKVCDRRHVSIIHMCLFSSRI